MRNIGFEKINSIVKNKKLSKDVENSIYDSCVKDAMFRGIEINENNKLFKLLYVNKLTSIYLNLDSKSYLKNSNFLKNIKNGKIKGSDVGFLEPDEIFPEQWKKYKDRQDAYEDFVYRKTASSITEDYKCGRCKQRKCTSYDLQTRSADEPMTTFVTCLNCGNRWSF